MTVRPLVSVLMTAFNREKYIAEAIESVLASTYDNFELIIVDDVSKDGTVLIAQEYAAKDDRIKVYSNQINLGDYPNRNKAASYATGKYLKYLDSDDTIYPWGLAVMVYCMETCPDAGYGLLSHGVKTTEKFPVLFTPAQAYYSFYFKGAMVLTGPTGAIIKREVFEKEQGFSGKPYIGDSEFWLKLSKNYSLVALPLDLIWWRQHEQQQIKEGHNNNYYQLNSYSLFLNALESKDCPLSISSKKMAMRNLKNRYARNIMTLFAKGKVSTSINQYKKFDITLTDLYNAIHLNKYPKEF